MVSALGTFVVAMALYWPTLMPGVGFWDTAEYQTVGPVLGIAHPTGFPSYTLLTWLASIVLQPFGDTAFRLNLFSAILVAGACALLAATIERLTHRPIPAVAAGVILATAQIAWWTSERAESHALHLFLSLLILYLLVAWAQRVRDPGRQASRLAARDGDWLLLAASVVYAVSLGNHGLTLLLAPGIALFLLVVQPNLPVARPRLVLACAATIVLITAALYAYIPIRASMNPPLDYAHPTTPSRFLYLVLGVQFQGLLTNPLQGGFGPIADLFSQQIGIVAFAVAAIALVVVLVARSDLGGRVGVPVAVLTVAWFAVVTVFSRGYNDGEPDRYFLGPISMIAFWAGIGAALAWDVLAHAIDRFRARHRGMAVPAAASLIAAAIVLAIPAQHALAGRDQQAPEAQDDAGARWLDAAYAALPPDAVVVSWWSYSTTLWYGRWVEGRRPDVQIVDDRNVLDDGYGTAQAAVDHFLALGRPVYLIRQPQDIPAFASRYRLVAYPTIPGYSPLWKVVR